MLLILDLDDTLFETKSMNPELFGPVFEVIENYYSKQGGEIDPQVIITDLWKFPFDQVILKHHIPRQVEMEVYDQLKSLSFDLDIQPFEDYPIVNALAARKILVTTGFTNLQWAKIEALGIKDHFEAIYIDDPLHHPRKDKYELFQAILQKEKKLIKSEIWVIGDNPNSEIKAGKRLGLSTIQRIKEGQEKSEDADYAIVTFADLAAILGRSAS